MASNDRRIVQRKWVLKDSQQKLNEDEIKVLSKGSNFATVQTKFLAKM